LAAHGNLDEGTYGKYINQAEEYLDKYGAKGQSAAGAGAPPASAEAASDVPARTTDQSDGSFQSPPDRSVSHVQPKLNLLSK